ncbi:MAG: pyruvate kinase [Planctomycetota bacterium]|nr:pyruvate kinase [Planctomycetota bacterium]
MRGSSPTRTRVVATVGPACRDPEGLRRLLQSGVSVLRLNLSHGTLEDHLEIVRTIRGLEREEGRPVAIMADLPGPKIRVDEASSLDLPRGAAVELVETPESEGDDDAIRIRIDVPRVLGAVRLGHRVLLDDGNVRLLVVEVDGGESPRVRCNVTSGGVIRPRVGVNVPDSDPELPAVTATDLVLARRMQEAEVDFLAVSFVRDGDDLRRLSEALSAGPDPPAIPRLVSKIERPAALAAIEDVIDASDVVLVARGDLGVELDIAEVPIAQKRIVAKAIERGCPVIVATQMLQSMIDQPGPTRAEATDVANAVLDGADALMLSGETAIGRHPALAVEMLQRIAARTERWGEGKNDDPGSTPPLDHEDDPWLPAIVQGARRIADRLPIRAMVAWAEDFDTARVLSRGRRGGPLLVLTDTLTAARRMSLLHGVTPVAIGGRLGDDRERFLHEAGVRLVSEDLADPGDTVLFVHGSGRRGDRPTDGLGVFTVPESRP